MKSIMKIYIYWPGINKIAENLVKCCQKYARPGKSPTKEIQPQPKIAKSWFKLNFDYTCLIDGTYDLVVDTDIK